MNHSHLFLNSSNPFKERKKFGDSDKVPKKDFVIEISHDSSPEASRSLKNKHNFYLNLNLKKNSKVSRKRKRNRMLSSVNFSNSNRFGFNNDESEDDDLDEDSDFDMDDDDDDDENSDFDLDDDDDDDSDLGMDSDENSNLNFGRMSDDSDENSGFNFGSEDSDEDSGLGFGSSSSDEDSGLGFGSNSSDEDSGLGFGLNSSDEDSQNISGNLFSSSEQMNGSSNSMFGSEGGGEESNESIFGSGNLGGSTSMGSILDSENSGLIDTSSESGLPDLLNKDARGMTFKQGNNQFSIRMPSINIHSAGKQGIKSKNLKKNLNCIKKKLRQMNRRINLALSSKVCPMSPLERDFGFLSLKKLGLMSPSDHKTRLVYFNSKSRQRRAKKSYDYVFEIQSRARDPKFVSFSLKADLSRLQSIHSLNPQRKYFGNRYNQALRGIGVDSELKELPGNNYKSVSISPNVFYNLFSGNQNDLFSPKSYSSQVSNKRILKILSGLDRILKKHQRKYWDKSSESSHDFYNASFFLGKSN